MQTKGLIPFKYEIFHPMACLNFLGIGSNLPSYEAFGDEELTTGHWSPSSKYAYFNYVRRGLRSSFRGSSFSLALSINKGRISSFFFQGQKAAHKFEGSSNFSGSSANSSINSACSCSYSHYSSTMVSIKHTLSRSSSSGRTCFLLR